MLTIANDGLFYSEFEEAKDKKIISDDSFLYYLSDDVTFSDDLTFGRLFELFIKNKDTLNMIFSRSMGNYKIDDFIEDFEGIPKEEKNFYLTISAVPDLYKDEITIYYAFGGFNETEKIGYSISFSKLCDLKNLIIKIDNNFDIIKISTKGKVKEILKSKITNIRLFDVIQSILNEISFYGNPENREEIAEELVNQSDIIDEAIKNGTIDKITKPWNEVKIELEQHSLDEAIKEENYEEAAKIQKKINKLKKKTNEK